MYANGRQNSRWVGGSTVAMKGTPVLIPLFCQRNPVNILLWIVGGPDPAGRHLSLPLDSPAEPSGCEPCTAVFSKYISGFSTGLIRIRSRCSTGWRDHICSHQSRLRAQRTIFFGPQDSPSSGCDDADDYPGYCLYYR